jgi:hypothetical protein
MADRVLQVGNLAAEEEQGQLEQTLHQQQAATVEQGDL